MGKYKTEHTEHVKAEDAPDFLQPFTRIEDVDTAAPHLVDPDTSENAAVLEVMGDDSLVKDAETRELMLERYNEYYGQLNDQLNGNKQKELEKQTKKAEKALAKEQKKEEKAAKHEKRAKNEALWGDEHSKEFMADYLAKDAVKELEKQQETEKTEAEAQARPKDDRLWSEEYKKKFIQDYQDNEDRRQSDGAASSALSLAAKDYLGSNSDAMAAVATKQKEAENKCRMDDMITYMAGVSFEYLTRGATMACSCGAVWRRLNLPKSHGVYYGGAEDPVINVDDNQVGDSFNITNFGLCCGSNPPLSNQVVLDDMVYTDEMGRFMAPQEEDTIRRGYGCVPEIIDPGWHNTYKRTQMGQEGLDAVSTKSFLVCLHGGIIYPINSGQHSSLVDSKQGDGELNRTFDQVCSEYNHIQSEKTKVASSYGGYEQKQRLDELYQQESACVKKMESCMDRARGDGYQKGYDDIPPVRRDTMEHMLTEYTRLVLGGKAAVPSLKSDYYRYRRKNGYTLDSSYHNDHPGFKAGSDSYTDWRAGRLENMGKKEAKAEFKAWEEDVDTRGYDSLTSYEKEEFDKARTKYGK